MTLRPGQFTLNKDRDVPLLKFLWRWKLATTAAIAAKFFPGRYPTCSYNRLLKLKKYGVIEQRFGSNGEASYWALTKRGFAAIQFTLPRLREEGFRSEHVDHDALVTAFHIGDWLIESPEGVQFFSEQQLRRIDSSAYPAWVPRSPEHRADGYWGFLNRGSVTPVAIEVELNCKANGDYEDLGSYYSDQKNVHRVLWLVTSLAIASRIQTHLEKGAKTRTKIHNFVRVKDFVEHCWDAPIILGPEREKTVSQFLNQLGGKPLEKLCIPAVPIQPHPLLNTQKSLIKSKASSFPAKTPFHY